MRNIFKKNELKKDHQVNKSFSYDKNGTNLNFTLRVDNNVQLENFLECLKQAFLDVQEEINKPK